MANKSEKYSGVEGRKFMLNFGAGGDPFSSVTVADPLPLEDDPIEVEGEVENDMPNNVGNEDEAEEIVGEETEEEEGDGDEEGEVEDDRSVYYHIASGLKGEFLPEDFEVDEKIDAVSLKARIKETLREEIEPAIKSEVHQNLIEQGYSMQDLVVARAIRQGVDPRLLSEASMYETYATMSDKVEPAVKKSVASQMYRTRGFKDVEIESLIQSAEDSGKLDNLYKESKTFFEGKYGEFVQSEDARAEELKKQAKAQVSRTNDLIDSIIKTRKIKNIEFTESQATTLSNAIKKQDKVMEVGGQKYRASEIQEFLYNFQVDDEMKLLAFYLYKFQGEHAEKVKQQAKREVEDDFLKPYKTRVLKSKKPKSDKPKVPVITKNTYKFGF